MDVRKTPHEYLDEIREELDGIRCADAVNLECAYKSLGTLGGGNHFIEIDREDIPQEMAWVEGGLFEDYIHDMKVLQKFALLNRKAMVKVIMDAAGLTENYRFTTIHNYIDTDSMILRKGAVSAKKDEIIANIEPTAEIVKTIKPVYNFKAAE